MFLGKGVLKICSKFTGEHPYRSVISIKLPCNVFKIFSQDILANYPFDKKSKLYFQINSEKLEKRTRYNMIHRKTFIPRKTDSRLAVSAILESTMPYFGDISESQSERIKT